MAGDVYGTSTLLSVMEHQKVLTPFWLNMFTEQINFETEEIFFDRVNTDYRRLAPFVAPNVQGRVQGRDGYDSVSFRPAYVKPKDIVDPNKDLIRRPGEALGVGSLSNAQRRDAVIAEIMRQHRTKLTNTNEWLAARALIDAEVTISGEDYPSQTVNFRRHSSLNYNLTGTARWSQSGSDPLADIKLAKQNSFNRSGVRNNRLVFGVNAWEYFVSRVDLKDLMDKNIRGSDTEVTRLYDGYEGQEYLGKVSGMNGAGGFEVWIDSSKYVDSTGAEQFFLDQDTVVGVSTFIQGVRCFGAIRDAKAGLRPMEVFSKMWENQDPSVEYILSQSAPLMVPRRPNASFKIKVQNAS